MDVKTLCLGSLMLGDASGYEIKKQFEEGPFSYFHAAGFGSIYPALNALTEAGLVTCTQMAQEGRPDKKVYCISEAGRAAFQEILNRTEPAADKIRSENMFLLFFGDLVEPERLSRLFDAYLESFRKACDCIEERDAAAAAPGKQFVRGLGIAYYRSVVEYMENNRHLLFADEPESGKEAPYSKTGTDR
jgi:PadR family transcriptional regulator, regulatory protein AphA